MGAFSKVEVDFDFVKAPFTGNGGPFNGYRMGGISRVIVGRPEKVDVYY